MAKLHAKSSCCYADVYRYCQRRRRCSTCGRTWSIRPKKRGRRKVRVHPNIHQFAGPFQESLRAKSRRLHRGREVIRRRHRTNMEHLLKLQLPALPAGPYIAVIDGFVMWFQGQPWTLYLVLIRTTTGTVAYLMEPLIKAGAETILGWKRAFATLPIAAINQLRAVVSDGIIGIDRYARARNWAHQRCHCHLIRTLYPLLGLRKQTVRAKKLRLTAFEYVKQVLTSRNESEVRQVLRGLRFIAKSPRCPRRFGLKLRGFLQSYRQFRCWRYYPEFNLPVTTNSAERVCGQITELIRRTRSFRNPESYLQWVKIMFKISPTIQCNGTLFQQN